MATFILLPYAVTGTNEWEDPSGGACAASNVDNDNDNVDYCSEPTNSHEITFTMAAPSVAEAAIDEISSVRISLSAAYTATSGAGTPVRSYMEAGGSSTISNGYNTHTIAIGDSYTTYNGDVESYATGTTDWTYQNLEDLEIRLDKIFNTQSRKIVKVSYLYVTVTYTAAGYGHGVIGIDSGDISKVNGIATADISKVNGV